MLLPALALPEAGLRPKNGAATENCILPPPLPPFVLSFERRHREVSLALYLPLGLRRHADKRTFGRDRGLSGKENGRMVGFDESWRGIGGFDLFFLQNSGFIPTRALLFAPALPGLKAGP